MNAGDHVRIVTYEGETEGILMPRPEILDEDIVIVKLDSGYNIGIRKERIKDMKVISEYKPPKQASPVSHKKGLPTVSILSVGGTISSKVDYKTGGVYADYTAEDFVQMVPELQEIANLKACKIDAVMSEDMEPYHWEKIAKAVEKELEESDGVIVTQGTDTLHFTAAALSFMVRSKKPVIITASQRSIDRGSSDAFMNLKCAVVAATSNMVGVMTCLHGKSDDSYCLLLNGTKVRKMHSSRRDAFQPINTDPLGKVYADGTLEILHKRDINHVVDIGMEKAGLLYTYPGMEPEQLDHFKNYKGLVIVGTGLGNIPQKLFLKVQELIDSGVIVVITTQTLYGATHPLVYQNLRMLSIRMKCVFVHDMLPETAYVKLCWALAHEKPRELMEEDVAGEFNPRLTLSQAL
ncbi:MAG: Glu-tRNA(Gln) amidotransferase subunit GatD [Candidatus Woesearchaeota archaeon]